ncbi:pseudouridylate synthase [Pontibacter sp. MBLB2868]|uniref:pseudouridylate synthase n=1 Tax=Pontibacter sp. MBLB2868 TaxID=3451555 RepID=UPI003F750F72
MTEAEVPESEFFIPFGRSIDTYTIPESFTYPFSYKPHPLTLLASAELQCYLRKQEDWVHNFGLETGQEGVIIGKMFGVLVVETKQHNIGYLAAFSGKLAGGYHHAKFVPPIFDALANDSFLNAGMQELSRINAQIVLLLEDESETSLDKISMLQKLRKSNSIALQSQLFDQYHFLNQAGEEKSLRKLFQGITNNNPPAGAGECAAPKLLQYAFRNQMKPLAMAEFWWGQSPKSDFWKHRHYYPACREKCAPILAHMLTDIPLDESRPDTYFSLEEPQQMAI